MADNSKIEWTDSTWQPITGCTLVSSGCKFCYAATLAAGRLRHHPSRAGLARVNAAGEAKFTGEVRFNEEWLNQPLRWRRPRRVFVCAHGDLFHEAVPDEWIDRVFAVMARASQHVFQVLTKRPERARAYLEAAGERCWEWQDPMFGGPMFDPTYPRSPLPLPNVWLGASVEDQAAAEERLPHLQAAPAAVHFVSYEPALGGIDFRRLQIAAGEFDALTGKIFDRTSGCIVAELDPLDLIIAGGESGPRARPAHPDWFRSTRDQCAATGVAYFHKQNGAWEVVYDRRRRSSALSLLSRPEETTVADLIERIPEGFTPGPWPIHCYEDPWQIGGERNPVAWQIGATQRNPVAIVYPSDDDDYPHGDGRSDPENEAIAALRALTGGDDRD